jgi:YVTN family beta-propeller protein
VSVIDPVSRRVVANWPVPGGGSPDMGNVTADGRELWVSGRYDEEVYVFDTRTGQLTHRIPVGREPHGLCVWPQPGRFSLGHTGNMR